MLTRVLPILPTGRDGGVRAGTATATGRLLRSLLFFLRFLSFPLLPWGELARLVRRSRFSVRPDLRVPPLDFDDDLEDDLCEPFPEDRLDDLEEDLEDLLLWRLPGAAWRGDLLKVCGCSWWRYLQV